MKTKKVILKESDIKNIVEKVINELDWRTYASAYDKTRSDWERGNRFRNATNNAFNRQNGYGLTNIPRGDGDPEQARPKKPNSSIYGGGLMYLRPGEQFSTFSGRLPKDGETQPTQYTSQEVNTYDTSDYGPKGTVTPDDEKGVKKGTTLNPVLNYRRKRGDQQVRDFYSGKTKYTPGRGWHNESIIRSLTESIMEKIKKM